MFRFFRRRRALTERIERLIGIELDEAASLFATHRDRLDDEDAGRIAARIRLGLEARDNNQYPVGADTTQLVIRRLEAGGTQAPAQQTAEPDLHPPIPRGGEDDGGIVGRSSQRQPPANVGTGVRRAIDRQTRRIKSREY